MKIKLNFKNTFFFAFVFATLTMHRVNAQAMPLPFQTVNNSEYLDSEVYIAVMGKVGNNFVWLDLKTGQTKQTLTSYNTLTASNGTKYANVFVKLSELSNNEIAIPIMKSSRVYYSFKKPLYFKFYGANTYYSTPDMNNSSDINYGTRWEFVEFNIEDNGGIWANTSRVDFYQYPIGLEIYGTNNYYGKVGETMSHDEIISKWNNEAESPYKPCLDSSRGVIQAPANLNKFKSGGLNQNYFSTIIDDIWSRYSSENLKFRDANNQVWSGRVSGNVFTFTNQSTNKVAIINGKPTTHNILSGAGLLWNDYASTSGNDIDLQKHFTAALNRGVLTATAASNVTQDWSDESKYYKSSRYNGYSKFFHSDGVSHNSQTYTFALDDVFDHSSLLFTSKPTKAVITIGGYSNTCAASSITSYVNVNSSGWKNTNSVSVNEGDTVKFGPHPTSGGSWKWSGPNSFSSSSREFTLTNITTSKAGIYTGTYTKDCGTISKVYVTVSVSSSLTTAPTGATIWLKSVSNSQYVCADQMIATNGPLYANRWTYAGWESFTVIDAGNGVIRLKSAGTGNQIQINPNTTSINCNGGTGSWTALTWISNSDGTISIKANINGKYLSNNNNSQILADTSSKNNNEKFTYGIISQSKTANTNTKERLTSVFPNPAKNAITIKFGNTSDNVITVLSITGQKVLETTTENTNSHTLDISKLPSGVYFFENMNDGKLKHYKFVKE